MTEYGKLYLIPTVIAEDTAHNVISEQVRNELVSIRHFLAENVRTARRFISGLNILESVEALRFTTLDKNTRPEELAEMFAPAFKGHHLGVLSESGSPGVADPGALAVRFAHDNGITVVPLAGPSSIILALAGSGLNGQHFAFHGYLPVDADHARKVIRELEKQSATKGQTQIFIETPYRNNRLLKKLIESLKPETHLCVAVDLTGRSESIRTMAVRKWKTSSAELPKLPAVFLFNATARFQ